MTGASLWRWRLAMFVQTVKMEHFDRAGKENRFRLIKRKDIKEIQRSSSEQARVFWVLKLWQLGRTLKGHSSNFICQSVFFFLQRLDCTFSSLKKLLKLCQLRPGDQKSSEESHVWWTRGLKFEHVGVYQAGECERGCSVPVFLDLGPNVSSSASHFDCSFLKNPVSCESHYGLTLLNSWVSPLIRIFHANNKMRHAVSLIRCLLVKSQEQFDGFLYLLSCWV